MTKHRAVNILFVAIFLVFLALDFKTQIDVWVYPAILLAYILMQAYGAFNASAQFFLPVQTRGGSSEQVISITFDDGPVQGKTERVLDVLKKHDVSAAFFCIGHRSKENPEILKRIQDEGHLLGNHSFWHGKFFDLQSAGDIAGELTATDAVIHQYTGLRPRFFRPPYGVTNPMVAAAVRQKGYVTIGWSLRSFDTVIKDRTTLLERITRSVKGGDIVLFHDHSESMIQILPAFLQTVEDLGLKIVRIDELLKEKAYVG